MNGKSDQELVTPEYEIPVGCPDWGPPGARQCYECGEPVDEDRRCCTKVYDDPLAALLGGCEICHAPNYQVFGACPECGGAVFKLHSGFGCYNTTRDACKFFISIDRLDQLGLEPWNFTMYDLLHGGQEICVLERGGNVIQHAMIILLDDGCWDVHLGNGPLPKK